MPVEIPIQVGPRAVGQWRLTEECGALNGKRTAEGFSLTMPSRLRLDLADSAAPVPVVTRLRVELFAPDGTELGIARDEGTYYGASPWWEGETMLVWRGAMAALALLEKSRGGTAPELNVSCRGEAYLLYADKKAGRTRGEVAQLSGSGRLTYAQDAWNRQMLAIGTNGNILVETPAPGSCPAGWDELWRALDDAQASFVAGGGNGLVGLCSLSARWSGKMGGHGASEPGSGMGEAEPQRS